MPSTSVPPQRATVASYARIGPGLRRMTAFGLIGALNLVLNIGLFTLLTTLTTTPAGWASFVSASVTTVLSFVLNRRYAFTDTGPAGFRAFTLFVIVNLVGIGLETALVAGAAGVFDIRQALPLDAVKVAAIGIGTAFRYAAYRYVVFPSNAAQATRPPARKRIDDLVSGVLPVRTDTD